MARLQFQVDRVVFFTMFFVLLPVPVMAVGFLGAPTYPTGSLPAGVAVADFNHDGRLDMALPNAADGTVSTLLNNGDGTFAPHRDFAAGNGGPVFIATADFNGDGNADVVVINSVFTRNHNLTVLLGNVDGTLQPPSAPILAGAEPAFVVTGDFNGDGKIDLAVVNKLGNSTASILIGNGDGTFQPAVAYAVGNSAEAAVAADFNTDGKLDLAVADTGGNSISVLLGNGDGSFQTSTSYPVGTLPASIAAGDLNGDGKLDLATANESSDVSILFGNGDGTFQKANSQSVGVSTLPLSVLITDVNNDGRLDLAVTSAITDDLLVLLGNGDGTFQVPVGYALENFSFAAGDFDGDGSIDFAAPFADQVTAGAVELLLGNGDGTLRSARSYTAESSMFSVAVGDFNLDGKLDVVTSGGANQGSSVALLSGLGDGTFRRTVTFPVSAGSIAVVVADFNVDGKPDVADLGTTKVSVLLGKGDGTFQPPVTSPAESVNNFLIAGDFNGDGKPDLAVLPFLGILLGNGDGTFQPPITYTPSGTPLSMATADFNADGKLDIAVSIETGEEIFLGNGDGTFHRVGTSAGGYGSIAMGDFNGDGKPDLATANPATNVVEILLGNGDGSFQPPVCFPVTEPTVLVALDANGDGKLDLAAGDGSGGNLGLLLGNGDGTFQSAINYPTVVPLGLVAGDFNGDGASDLILSDGSSISVVSLLNTGGTFPVTTSSQNPSKSGQPVTFTTTVTPTFSYIGTPTGTVTFKDGTKTLGRMRLSGGKASLTTSTLSVGRHKISAIYSGDANFNPNAAPILKQKVTQ